ncbi:MAG: PAS domain S-box protein [Methylocella sp.]
MNDVRNGNEIYQSMLETILDCAICMLDVEGRVVSWNAGAERIKGYRAAEIIGRHFSVFYPPEDARSGKPERELVAAADRSRFEDQGWRVRKDGARFWAHIVITAMRNGAGELQGFVNLTRDLTEQKRTEDELRRSQERFQRAVESAPNAMMMVNRTGRIEMLNLQAECVFGYSRDELLGQPVEMLLPERYRRYHPKHRLFFFAEPRSRPMGAGRDLYALRKDGSEFPVEIGLNPIETAEGSMVLAAIVDITERKQKEDELRRGQERFQRVVEWVPNAIMMVNRRGQIEMINLQAERIFGYSRAELLGQSIEILVPERLRRQHVGFRTLFFAGPEEARPMGAGRDLYGVRKDGSEFPVEIGLNPIEVDDRAMVLASIVDITDRKLKEEQIQSDLKEKDALIREIHHRVKNNLQIVDSMLHLLSAKIDDKAVLDAVKDCQNRIQSMALIHHMLYQSNDFAKVDFARFLESLAPALITAYGVDPNRIAVSIDAAPVLLPMDAAIPCGQVANELLTNAFKHAFPQGRRGNIAIDLTQDAKGDVVLSVMDDGVGIADGIDVAQPATLGLQLVNLLTGQLGGTFSVQRTAPTRIVLQFPGEGRQIRAAAERTDALPAHK